MSLSHIYKQLRNYFRSPNDDSLPGEQVSCSASTVRLQYDVRRFTTKVSDFGLSRLLPDHSPKLGSNAEYTGTITHMAPELLEHGGMSRAADVYSFGVLSIPPPPPSSPHVLFSPPTLLCWLPLRSLRVLPWRLERSPSRFSPANPPFVRCFSGTSSWAADCLV